MIAQNESVKLITIANIGKDADGFPIEEVLQETEMFASVQSVKMSEYYAALREGIRASKTILLFLPEFLINVCACFFLLLH